VGDALLKDTNEITIKDSQLNFIIELNKSLDIITSELKEYLKDIKAHSVDRDVRSNLNEILADNYEHNQQIMYLNFNYTSTIELYLGETEKSNVNYIHGDLRDKDNPIIFGYGDEPNQHYVKIENLNNNELTRHLKSFSYLKTYNYQKLFNFLEKGEFNVYIMGHSCGISDRVLFTNILNHHNFKNGKIKLYYYHYGTEEWDNDFFQKTQELSRHFDINSKHLMRTKVVPFSDSKPLTPYKPIN